MYEAGCGPGGAQYTGRAVGQVVHNVRGRAGCGPGDAQCTGQGRLWARWCTMYRVGCGPGGAQCTGWAVGQVMCRAGQAVGQVMHNVHGRAGCGPGDAQCAVQGRLWAR